MSLLTTLAGFGADSASLRLFDGDTPELLPYATLVNARAQSHSDLTAVDGVYEWQDAPLMYVIDGERVRPSADQLARIRRLLAMRGDTPYLGVIVPGRLTVYRIALDDRPPDQARVDTQLPEGQQFATLAHLANNRPGITRTTWISQVVLKLLSNSIDSLREECNIGGNEAISLVGRALFTRFLADRQILPAIHKDEADPSEWFDDATRAKNTSLWLDQTFNGDFLPLSRGIFKKLPKRGYKLLGNILRRAPNGQLSLGWQEQWDNLDFAHIPVGVLSQAYENYLRLHQPDTQRREGGFYTPQPIAELMVKGAFRAVERDGEVHAARVLDPAVGAGIFLTTAFRGLVAARWRHDRKRPDTRTLRSILYNQVVGFDVNEAALRFAALGLYLLSIELDPHPEPLRKLKFKNLRGVVLHKFEGDSTDNDRPLGSLGKEVKKKHIGRYDLIVGNPPWASGTKLPNWPTVKDIVNRIATGRLGAGNTTPIPNEVLDLPFVWRAMEWAKPSGQIVFALHGRMLFQQGDGMSEARKALFQALDVTSIVNGAELRQTKVWPEISAPFCILFARNRLPPAGSGFRFVTPRLESSLNNSGGMRIDAASADLVTADQVVENAAVLKILSRGSQADLEVYDRILSKSHRSLANYWSSIFSKPISGNGYQKLRESSRVRKTGDGLKGASAHHLKGLPEITPESIRNVLVSSDDLEEFRQKRIHDPRPRELFKGPLLILQKSPPANLGRIRVSVSDTDVLFNESYYGYSAHSHSDGETLVRYLALILGSKPALWFALMTSGEFGFERDVVEKATIDRLLLPPPHDLRTADRKKIRELFDALVNEKSGAWDDVDAWAASLYGIKPRDLDVIADTLKYSLPFAENKRLAQDAPSDAAVRIFCTTLSAELKDWASRFKLQISAAPIAQSKASPWRTVCLRSDEPNGQMETGHLWVEFLKVADQMAASELILEDHQAKFLLIGRLDQARYWTKTRARLAARQMIWEHPNFFTRAD